MTLQAGMEARSPAQTVVGLLVSFPGDFGPFPIMEHQVWLSQAIRWRLSTVLETGGAFLESLLRC